MKKFEEMTFHEKMLRKIIIDFRNDIVGGLENSYLDMGQDDEKFIKEHGRITEDEICEAIYFDIMHGKEKFLVSSQGVGIEKKHIRFLGEEFIRELIADRVSHDHEKGWLFPTF